MDDGRSVVSHQGCPNDTDHRNQSSDACESHAFERDLLSELYTVPRDRDPTTRNGGDRASLRARDRLFALLTHGDDDPTWRAMSWAYALAMAAHLWLADAWQISWIGPDIMMATGALVVARWRCVAGWLLCAMGVVWPLMFLGDQLTQSVILCAWACSAAGAMAWQAVGGGARARATCIQIWRLTTASTYTIATLHKLNRDFLEPATSCAVYGWDEVITYWHLPPWLATTPEITAWLPALVLMTEGSIALCYAMRWRRVAWAIALAFHLPLTLTMAPAFALVMAAGHVSWTNREDLAALGAAIRDRRYALSAALFATIATAVSVWAHGAWPEPSMIPKEWAIWASLALVTIVWPPWTRRAWQRAPRPAPRARWIVAVVVGLYWLNCLTPYLGVQFQHAGAMLSNLRIDRGCWNSLVVPEGVRLTDDYVRVDEVYFVAPGHNPTYEAIVRDQLWSPPQLRKMIKNWCRPHTRPFSMQLRWREETIMIEDLCALPPDQLPFEGDGVFGVELFDHALRYQKNLARRCPQTCIH